MLWPEEIHWRLQQAKRTEDAEYYENVFRWKRRKFFSANNIEHPNTCENSEQPRANEERVEFKKMSCAAKEEFENENGPCERAIFETDIKKAQLRAREFRPSGAFEKK
jgi:hypothetical protein